MLLYCDKRISDNITSMNYHATTLYESNPKHLAQRSLNNSSSKIQKKRFAKLTAKLIKLK